MNVHEALKYIQENLYQTVFQKLVQMGIPFYKQFCQKLKEQQFNLKSEYWIPNEVYNRYLDVYPPYFKNKNNSSWLRQNRRNRPKSFNIYIYI